jgi:1,4-dihydroxy-2-naphthoyl-CoA hydrolase
MIWHKKYTLDEIAKFVTHENIVEGIGIEFTEIGDDFVTARMPVDKRTHQIHGILHGGASCVLAETIGSFASLMVVDQEKNYAVGSQISVNHLRPVKDGFVHAVCKPVHLGKSKHVWDILIESDQGKLVAKCELTCAVVNKP